MFIRAVNPPSPFSRLKFDRPAAWVTTTESAAIARSESKSGNRGLPGGGARASGAAAIGVG
jgi:hypothetical protein